MIAESELTVPIRPPAFATRYAILLLQCLLLLAGLLAVLWAGYLAATNRQNSRANGVTTPIAEGVAIGQTFVARYPDLAGVEAQLSTPGHVAARGATLIMHLKTAPGAATDLATSSIPPGETISDGSWYLFSFPPIADSQGKSYYVEFTSGQSGPGNALSIFRWQSDPKYPSDPYQFGTAYINRKPQQSDLAFGVRYTPSPIVAWQTMLGAALQGLSLSLRIVLASFGLLALMFCALLWFFRWRGIGMRTWLLRYALPIVLLATFVNGLLYVLLIPPWQGPDEHGHYTYVALLDRYGLSNRRVQALQWDRPGNDLDNILALKQTIVASMNRNDWTRRHMGDPLPGGTAFQPGPENIFLDFLWETRQPPTYYLLSALALRAARATGIPADPFVNPEVALRIMREVSLVLSLGIAALAWLAGKLLSRNRDSWLPLLLPLTVTLLPMNAFISSMASNDVMAELSATALFVCLVALVRRPFGWRAVWLAVLAILVGGLCVLSKSTAGVLVPPLLGLGLLLWAGSLLTAYLARRIGKHRARRLTPSLLIASLVLAAVSVVFLAFAPDGEASGWQDTSQGVANQRAPRVQSSMARDGLAFMQLPPGDLAYQWVDIPLGHPAMTMTLSVWVRVPTITGDPPRIGLLVDERGRLPRLGTDTLRSLEAWTTVTPTVAGAWVPATLSAPATVSDRKMMVRLMAGGAPTQFDSLSLDGTRAVAMSGQPSRITMPVLNPSFEIESIGMRASLERFVPTDEVEIIEELINRQSYDKVAVWQRFAYRQFRSFWGNFGWLSIPLPESVYALFNALVLGAFVGLAWSGLRRAGRWRWQDWLAPVCLVALGAIIVVGFARQMTSASILGVFTDPQGRYLFVMMTPVVWLLLSGLGALWSLFARSGALAARWAGADKLRPAGIYISMPWGVWLWSSGLIMFAGYSLLALILPYYYG